MPSTLLKIWIYTIISYEIRITELTIYEQIQSISFYTM